MGSTIPKESKPMKAAAVQAYTELGFGIRDIAQMIGIDENTVLKYRKAELDEEFTQFSSTIKKIFLTQDFEMAQMAIKHIKGKMHKARFYELVGLYKTVRDLNGKEQSAAPVVQINNIMGQMMQGIANE